MPAPQTEFAASLRFASTIERDAQAYGVRIEQDQLAALNRYREILARWNPRLHLVAPASFDDPEEFARRHILESLFALTALAELPAEAPLVDIGSGGGLPIVPLLIARPRARAVLVESNLKKSVFLREALAACGCADRARVIADRFEAVPAPEARALTTRALDRFTEMLPAMLAWARMIDLLLLFGGEELREHLPAEEFEIEARRIPNSEQRLLYVLRRVAG